MQKKQVDIVVGALLHDIGKLIFRCGKVDSRAHNESGYTFLKDFTDCQDVLESVRYHHKKHLKNAQINEKSSAYIVYIADNIASAIDRRDIEGESDNAIKFDKNAQLSTVFNILNGNSTHNYYKLCAGLDNEKLNYPRGENNKDIIEIYNKIFFDFKSGLKAVKFQEEYINSIMELNESYLQFIPSSTMTKQLTDISLFDHQKITAAVASCIYEYLESEDCCNYKEMLLDEEKLFYEKEVFLLYSCDISGIQQFIYTINSEAALKGLRARSFYLDVLLEHIADEMLNELNLCRANLIYTGGGHAYMLLSNTEEVKSKIKKIENNTNSWLMKNFGTALYIAMDYVECSGNDLMNVPADKEPYSGLYSELAKKLSRKKLCRYTGEEIRRLNDISSDDKCNHFRECKVCGTSTDLEETDKCKFCSGFEKISGELVKEGNCLMIFNQKDDKKNQLELPDIGCGKRFLQMVDKKQAKIYLEEDFIKNHVVRVYGKNESLTGWKLSTKVYMGDYHYKNDKGYMATFEELAAKSDGIERIGVLRADIDNLGMSFVNGFERKDAKNIEDKNRYITLTRTAVLSRYLSKFFKYYINQIIEENGNAVTIVYSGGDDMFIVGAWSEILDITLKIRKCFEDYTCGTLHFSAGIAIYNKSYPISRMAAETEYLEKAAKENQKNSVSILGQELSQNGINAYELKAIHTYKWTEYEERVIGEKLTFLKKYFHKESANTGELKTKGMSAMYALLNYIRGIEMDENAIENGTETTKINVARCAYYLAKVETSIISDNEIETIEKRTFTSKMYKWILDKEERRQLVTAMNLYSYSQRIEEGKCYGTAK